MDEARDGLDDLEETIQQAQQFIGELRSTNDLLRHRGDSWKDAAIRNAKGEVTERKLAIQQAKVAQSYKTQMHYWQGQATSRFNAWMKMIEAVADLSEQNEDLKKANTHLNNLLDRKNQRVVAFT